MTSENDVRAALRWQADYCAANGSPLQGRVLHAAAAVLDRTSETGRRILAWQGDPTQDALPLRLTGALHALVRSGRAGGLARFYAGDGGGPAELEAALRATIAEHDREIVGWLSGPPQTNEPGRSGPLMAGLVAFASLHPAIGGIELLEIGSSAGLNLMIGRYDFDLGGVRIGPGDSSVLLAPDWRGPPPPDVRPTIAAVRGVDIAPIDLGVPAEAERLLAYVWPDQVSRLERNAAAVAMAQARPPRLEQGDAAEWLAERLAEPQQDGRARVLMHSVVWPYLPPATQARIEALMTQAGARATVERPLGWLSYEWTGGESRRHALRLRTWPAPGTDRILAYVHAHGAWIEWLGAAGDQPAQPR
ncbi:MAG: hypothetical protein JWM38_1483 [Sphingomonas bacterium]|nr:hypothetical protein [Sphingomonas bacterium]